VPGAGLHGVVDLGDRADALLVGADRVEHVGHQQPVDDEAGRVARLDRLLAQLRAELEAGLERLLRGRHRPDDLDERHHLRRVEEVQAEEALGPRGRRRLVDDCERGGVGGEPRLRLDDRVDLAPHLELEREVLRDRLDHEVAGGEVAVFRRRGDPPAHRVGVGLLELALLDRPRELLLDLADALREAVVVDLAEHDVVARLRGDLGDAVPHQPGAEHADRSDLCHLTPVLVWVKRAGAYWL
jgi:hypothetical protein